MFGFEGATAIAPIDPVGWSSKIGFHVRPASVVFQTPPLFTPMKNVSGRSGIPAAPTVRPARYGPMHRQRRQSYMEGSSSRKDAAKRAASMDGYSRVLGCVTTQDCIDASSLPIVARGP